MGEQDRLVPEWTLLAFQAWTHPHSLQDCLVATTIKFQSLVSVGLAGGCDKFHSPQRWQPELFLEQRVVGEFSLAVAGDRRVGQGKSHTETGRAPLLHRPWHREATQLPGGPGTMHPPTTLS